MWLLEPHVIQALIRSLYYSSCSMANCRNFRSAISPHQHCCYWRMWVRRPIIPQCARLCSERVSDMGFSRGFNDTRRRD